MLAKKGEFSLFCFNDYREITNDSFKRIGECQYFEKLYIHNPKLKEKIENQKSLKKTTIPFNNYKNISDHDLSVAELVTSFPGIECPYFDHTWLYLGALKQAALLTHIKVGLKIDCKKHDKHFSIKCLPSKPSSLCLSASIDKEQYYYIFYNPVSKVMHRPLSEEFELFFKIDWHRRAYSDETLFTKEATFLIANGANNKKFLPLARTNSEPSLQPKCLINYFKQNLSLLQDPNYQTLFELYFFKEIVLESKKKNFVPLYMDLRQNREFFTHIEKFIKDGLNFYYLQQPGKRPDVQACLFFTRLLIRCATMAKVNELNEYHGFIRGMA